MTFKQFLSILAARKKLFLAVLISVLVPAILLSLILPKRYTAVASVVVDVKPDPLSATGYSAMMTPAIMATQADILTSDRVARKVVRNLKLAENPQIRQQWEKERTADGDIETWLVETFQKELDVKPSRESSVINVSYRAADPKFAAGLVNAFVQAYIETALDLRVDPAKQYSAFFELRVKEAREALEAAQAKLSAFQRDKGVVMTDERMDVENQRLNELSSQLVALQSLASEATSRQAQANSGSADKMQEITNNMVVATLRADLSRQEARFQELSSRLGEKNPQVVELSASIAELKARLDSEVKRLSAGVGVSSTISRQREAQTRHELEVQRAKILQMKQVRDEGLLFLRDVENAQRAFEVVVSRRNQTSLESQATLSNVSILNTASAPLEHSSPKVFLNSILALFVGLLMGVGAVLAAEFSDRRVRSGADITALVGVNLIGVLPGRPKSTAAGRLGFAQRQQRLIGQATLSK